MGNQIGVEKKPPDLSSILSLDLSKASYPQSLKSFPSCLHLWEFYTDDSDSSKTLISPVSLSTFNRFDKIKCYLALHIHLVPESTHSPPLSPNTTFEKTTNKYSLNSLLTSSSEDLTPRGLSSACANILEEPFNNTSKAGTLQHHIYIWNGTQCDKLPKAFALTKSFELDKALKTDKHVLDRLFYGGDKVEVSSVYTFDVKIDSKDNPYYKDNHLFRKIMELQYSSNADIQCISPQSNGKQKKPIIGLGSSASKLGSVTPTSREYTVFKNLFKEDETADSNGNEHTPKRKIKKKKKKKSTQTKPDAKRPTIPKLTIPPLNINSSPAIKTAPSKKPSILIPKLNTKGVKTGNTSVGVKISLPLPKPREPEPDEPSVDGDQLHEGMIKSRKLAYWDKICSKIGEGLYLGSRTVAQDRQHLQDNGITHILNCAGAICTNSFPDEIVYRTLFLYDDVREDITLLIYDIIEWIDSVLINGGRVLIHCHQGVSRSSAMMIGYLMWKWGWDYERTQAFVKAKRGVSSPNAGFIAQLLILRKRLTNARSSGSGKLYTIVPHFRDTPNFLVAKKEKMKEFDLGKPDLVATKCDILQTLDMFYVWVGSKAEENRLKIANETVKRIQFFEKGATENVSIVNQGSEPQPFLDALGKIDT